MEIPDGGSVSFLKLMLDDFMRFSARGGAINDPDDMESMRTPCHLGTIFGYIRDTSNKNIYFDQFLVFAIFKQLLALRGLHTG